LTVIAGLSAPLAAFLRRLDGLNLRVFDLCCDELLLGEDCCAARCRACSSAMRESTASLMSWQGQQEDLYGDIQPAYLPHLLD